MRSFLRRFPSYWKWTLNKEIIKKTFQLAQKYNKRVYGVVTNMSIAVERRDYLKLLTALYAIRLRQAFSLQRTMRERHRKNFARLFQQML